MGFVDDMTAEKRVLRSWRERLATPLKDPGEISGENTASTNPQTKQTPDSLRVSKWTETSTNYPQTPLEQAAPPLNVGNLSGFQPGLPYFEQIGPDTWVETDWSRGRCVFNGGHAPLAPGDRICCTEHRRQMDES